MGDHHPKTPEYLRSLAKWYREFAERTMNPTIWESRLRTAEILEDEAARLEQIQGMQILHR